MLSLSSVLLHDMGSQGEETCPFHKKACKTVKCPNAQLCWSELMWLT